MVRTNVFMKSLPGACMVIIGVCMYHKVIYGHCISNTAVKNLQLEYSPTDHSRSVPDIPCPIVDMFPGSWSWFFCREHSFHGRNRTNPPRRSSRHFLHSPGAAAARSAANGYSGARDQSGWWRKSELSDCSSVHNPQSGVRGMRCRAKTIDIKYQPQLDNRYIG